MRKYELMYIVRPTATEEEVKGTREKVEAIIENHQGHVIEFTDWGKRRFAYPLRDKSLDGVKYNEGYYLIYQFEGDEQVVSELNRVLNMNDHVIRQLSIRLEK